MRMMLEGTTTKAMTDATGNYDDNCADMYYRGGDYIGNAQDAQYDAAEYDYVGLL